jgi:peptidoglycan/xylan/chitin deacetylase (PgdA/CDA1 family)
MTRAIRRHVLFGPLGAMVVLAVAAAARAGDVPPTEALHSLQSAACANPNALGVSRVIEIDANDGPRFGVPGPEPFQLLHDKEVILTFDDGPVRRYTRPILDALDEQCVKATFFSVGRMALSDPQTLRDTADRGHTIAAHTWSHKRLDKLGAVASKQEVELGFSAVALALGRPVAPFFRFPYLGESSSVRAHLRSRHIATFAIDIDSRDFLTRNPTVMRQNVMSQLARKHRGIILFHDIQPSTAGGLRALLTELKANGYKIVHVVPKTGATTLPEFDAMADREAQRRNVALSLQPLADRAAVWPMSTGSPERLPWSADPTTADTKPVTVLPTPPNAPKGLPALPPPVRPNLKPAMIEDNWATNPLGLP